MLRRLAAAGAALAVSPAKRSRAAAGALTTRPVPSSGEPLPVVGLGTWQVFDVAEDPAVLATLARVLEVFAAAGARVVDSSPMYGRAESVLGRLAAEHGLRERLFVATKVWTDGRDEGIRQMERSLERLRVERLDLMQVHNLVDVETHTRTLREWQAEGRVRYVGITHYTRSAFPEVERLLARERYDFVQINYSIEEPEAERRLLPLAAERGTAVLVNRPYGQGGLFRRVRGRPLPAWAAEAGIASWGQFFLKWILGHPAVTCVIPGTGNPAHLADNLGAARGALPDAALRRRMAEHFRSL